MRIGRRRQKVTHLISRAEKARLRELIEQIDRETTAEICVMLLDDAEEPSEFARKYFDHLGIGKHELHNGILILAVVAKRQIEVVVGKGLREVAPQAFLEQVINDIMVPDFRVGRFADGLRKTVEAFGRVLRERRPRVDGEPPSHIPDVIDVSREEPR